MDKILTGNSMRKRLLFFIYISYIYYPLRNKLLSLNRSKKISNSSINENEITKQEELINIWMPQINWLGRFYYAFSTTIHSINFISSSILLCQGNNQLLIIENSSLTFLCHMPRFIVNTSFNYLNSIWLLWLCSSLHLTWRFLVLIFEGEFVLNSIIGH